MYNRVEWRGKPKIQRTIFKSMNIEGKIWLIQYKGNPLFVRGVYHFFPYKAEKLYFEPIARWRVGKMKQKAFTQDSQDAIQWQQKLYYA